MHPRAVWLAFLPLLMPATASAVSFSDIVVAWTVTTDGAGGSDGQDAALGVAITAQAEVIAAGYLDGAAGSDDDAYVVIYDTTGVTTWSQTTDAGPVGPTKQSSNDRYHAVALDPASEDFALCGVRSADPNPGEWLVEMYSGLTFTQPWFNQSADGLDSPMQACHALFIDDSLYATGWTTHGADAGRWQTLRHQLLGGLVTLPMYYDYLQYEAVPDQAYGIVTDSLGEITVVGQRGVAGAVGSNLNDADGHIRHHTNNGLLLWETSWAGAKGYEDRLTAVAVDTISRDLFVVGWENAGQNNGDGANKDWVIARYDVTGDGYGGSDAQWAITWESAAGADEGATSLALDENGDLLVGGWMIDAATGNERWRVARHAAFDGALLDEWLGPVYTGDARLEALSFRDGRVAMAGWIDDGAGADFAVSLMEIDSDGDGVADSVDGCPSDNGKVEEGLCGCGTPDNDSDGDGVENCLEECPSDPLKTEPGACGCDRADTDTDSDGTPDCNDDCPEDPNKDTFGECGCGVSDGDDDGDGVINCHDGCPGTEAGLEVDAFGCPPDPHTGDTGTSGVTPGASSSGGCGCTTGASPAGGFALLLTLVGLRRRRTRR